MMQHVQTHEVAGAGAPRATWQQQADGPLLILAGSWLRSGPVLAIEGSAQEKPPAHYDIGALGSYDSTLPAFLLACLRPTEGSAPLNAQLAGLPASLIGLLELALAVPEELGNQPSQPPKPKLRQLGKFTLHCIAVARNAVRFTGQTILAIGRLIRGQAHFRAADFWLVVQQCGVQALPIVSLISFLIGLILAFVGNVQLTSFGANLFVADLVGIAMVREMGVMMTAIIMSGRTGAAFAAFIGSMKANEEIDALQTFGFVPFDFLVLPRVLALVLMMPILTIYANLVGILGGMLVGAFVGIPPVLYWTETLAAVDLTNALLGVMKSVFFGTAIAISGCMQGMQAGNSSAGVGKSATTAVVTSITLIVVLDSAFAVLFTLLDI